MLELVYTSIPEGLQPGRSGYTSAAWTRGLSPMLVAPLENMSVYRHLHLPGTADRNCNPVSYSYTHVRLGHAHYPILSRIGDAGTDYTGRSNMIAHHILLEPEDQAAFRGVNPASLLLAEKNFMISWSGPARLLAPRTGLACAKIPLTAAHWRKYTGDAGYAGYAARLFMNRNMPGAFSCMYIEFPPEIPSAELLQLAAETAELLDPADRRAFTFNTCFFQAQEHIQCFLRCCIAGSPVVQTARQFRRGVVLTLPMQTPLAEEWDRDPLVIAARSGVRAASTIRLPDPAGEERKTIRLMPDAVRTAEPPPGRKPPAAGPAAMPPAEPAVRKKKSVSAPRWRMMIPVFLLVLMLAALGILLHWHIRSGRTGAEAELARELQPVPPPPAELHAEQPETVPHLPPESSPAPLPAEKKLLPPRHSPASSPRVPKRRSRPAAAPEPAAVFPASVTEDFRLYAEILQLAATGGGTLKTVVSVREIPAQVPPLFAMRKDGVYVRACREDELADLPVRTLRMTDGQGGEREMPWGMRPEYVNEYLKLYRSGIKVDGNYEYRNKTVPYSEFQRLHLRKNEFPQLDVESWNQKLENDLPEMRKMQKELERLRDAMQIDAPEKAPGEPAMRKHLRHLRKTGNWKNDFEDVLQKFRAFTAAAESPEKLEPVLHQAEQACYRKKEAEKYRKEFRRTAGEWQELHPLFKQYQQVWKKDQKSRQRFTDWKDRWLANARRLGLDRVFREYLDKDKRIPLNDGKLMQEVRKALAAYPFFRMK